VRQRNLILAAASPPARPCAALGGSRYRLVRQLVTESCAVPPGAGAGLVVSSWTTGAIRANDPATLPRVEVALNPAVVGFAWVLDCAGIAFGAVPAIQSSRVPWPHACDCRARQHRQRRSRMRRSLVVAQVALSVVPCRRRSPHQSFVRLLRVPSASHPKTLTFRLSLPPALPGWPQVTGLYATLLTC
jgi:hypothetical protein